MSKIEAGRTTLNPSTFDPPVLLTDLEMMFRVRPDEEAELFQKIHTHLGLEYVYAGEPADAAPEATMREAVITADLDQLLTKIQEVKLAIPALL